MERSVSQPSTCRIANKLPSLLIRLDAFVKQVKLMHKDLNLLFSEEYEILRRLSPEHPSDIAYKPQCWNKNRYSNVLPYDHARVKLLASDDNELSDYINASFISGFRGPREYIAAQGPLPGTVDDFWRMVWEQKASAVVMLTKCIENGQIKCEQYWPSDPSTAKLYGDINVHLRSESVFADYIIRVIDLELGSTKRTVHQFHFLKFPEYGSPDKTSLLLNLVAAVRDHTPYNPNSNSPTIVHCSGGVGRTGTFIALDVLMNQFRDGNCKEVDIFNIIYKMRENRTRMVETEDQYIHIFDCLRDTILENHANSVTNKERD